MEFLVIDTRVIYALNLTYRNILQIHASCQILPRFMSIKIDRSIILTCRIKDRLFCPIDLFSCNFHKGLQSELKVPDFQTYPTFVIIIQKDYHSLRLRKQVKHDLICAVYQGYYHWFQTESNWHLDLVISCYATKL